MFYIGKDDSLLDTLDPKTCEQRILMYDYKVEDYFLEYSISWNSVTTPIYTVLLGERLFNIPSSSYVICGDVGGATDIVIFDEIIGRDINIINVVNDYRKLEWHIPRIVDVDNDGKLLYPMISGFVPLTDKKGETLILTSGSDRIGGKTLRFNEFIV